MHSRRSIGWFLLAATSASAGSELELLIADGQALPGGGNFDLSATENPATVSRDGRIAFYSRIENSPRNQGIFSYGPEGIEVVAMGCGGPGGSGIPGTGCGDPTPLGGTFSGFFSGIYFVPASNAWGDVLFLADVDGGNAPRGLFLWNRREDTIRTIAAVGHSAPSGSPFGSLGTGVLNDDGVVVFFANEGSSSKTNIYEYREGIVRRLFAIGDHAPMGGIYELFANDVLGFDDLTHISAGPLPAIDADGRVIVRAQVKLQIGYLRGLISREGDLIRWIVNQTDSVPGGGKYVDFQAPLLNEQGELAFYANVAMPDGFDAQGWFFGRPNAIVRAVSLTDVLGDGARVLGLAASRGPMSPLDDAGNLAVWADVMLPDGSSEERILLHARTGDVTTVIRKGASLESGTIGAFQSLPSLDEHGNLVVSFETPGAASGNAHYLAHGALPWEDVGDGKPGSAGLPQLIGLGDPAPGLESGLRIDTAPPSAAGVLIVGDVRLAQPWLGGMLVPAPNVAVIPIVTDVHGFAELVLHSSPTLPHELWFQAWFIDPGVSFGVTATNALLAHTK